MGEAAVAAQDGVVTWDPYESRKGCILASAGNPTFSARIQAFLAQTMGAPPENGLFLADARLQLVPRP